MANFLATRVWNMAAKQYQKMVVSRLNQYGLKYDDILNEDFADVKLAVSRLPRDQQIARDRRLKRALDISFKKKPLPEEVQLTLNPLEPYLQSLLVEAQAQRLEREMIMGPR